MKVTKHPPETYEIHIVLSAYEASVLRKLCQYVAGNITTSPRMVTDELASRLAEFGVKSVEVPCHGSVEWGSGL